MKNKVARLLLASVLFLAAGLASYADGRSGRMLFQIGAGMYAPTYPTVLQDALDTMESYPGVDRMKVGLDLALGTAVSEQAYLLLRMDGGGDRLSDSSGSMQLNYYLASIGARYYFEPSGGFFLEGNAGTAFGLLQATGISDTRSDNGFGFGAGLGYDFNRRPTGFGLVLEARYNSLNIESDNFGQFMLTLNLCWK
jgi:hypothetical protein